MRLLGIEIGGTKLQLGVGDGESAELEQLIRRTVCIEEGAEGILRQIDDAIEELVFRDKIDAVGVGFGGPVDPVTGCVRLSHQVHGWEGFPLVEWCQRRVGPTVLANDCDTAAVGESVWGAGRDCHSLFYVTVGTGIGGGHVVAGKLQGAGRPSVAEIGHLRIGNRASAGETIESVSSGAGIAERARLAMTSSALGSEDPLLAYCTEPSRLSAELVAKAAIAGSVAAKQVLREAVDTLAWAIATTVTLLAPELVVVGGGVPQMPDELFWGPLQEAVRQLVFPPLVDSFSMRRAALGEAVVVHGAIALARRHALSAKQANRS